MDTTINDVIQRCEIITLAANHLTEYRLSDNPTLEEMLDEIQWAVMSAMETKGISPDSNVRLFLEIKEHFFTLFDKFNDR